jgi:hypothetical protein
MLPATKCRKYFAFTQVKCSAAYIRVIILDLKIYVRLIHAQKANVGRLVCHHLLLLSDFFMNVCVITVVTVW